MRTPSPILMSGLILSVGGEKNVLLPSVIVLSLEHLSREDLCSVGLKGIFHWVPDFWFPLHPKKSCCCRTPVLLFIFCYVTYTNFEYKKVSLMLFILDQTQTVVGEGG